MEKIAIKDMKVGTRFLYDGTEYLRGISYMSPSYDCWNIECGCVERMTGATICLITE